MGKRKLKTPSLERVVEWWGADRTGEKEVLQVWSIETWNSETLSGDLLGVKIILIRILRHSFALYTVLTFIAMVQKQ